MSMVMGGTCGRIWAGVSEMTSNVLKFHSRKLQDPDKVIEYLQKKMPWLFQRGTTLLNIMHHPQREERENKTTNSRAKPDTRLVTFITKRKKWNHKMGQVRRDHIGVIWSKFPAQAQHLEHIAQDCFQMVLEDLLRERRGSQLI